MTPDASTTDASTPANLLADLESRQDELLRLLGELEERTKQALANLTASAQLSATGEVSAKPVHGSIPTPPSVVAASAPIQSGIEPSPRVATDDEKKSSRSSSRPRSRKAA